MRLSLFPTQQRNSIHYASHCHKSRAKEINTKESLNCTDTKKLKKRKRTNAYMQKEISTREDQVSTVKPRLKPKDGTSDESSDPTTIFRDDETIAEFLVSMSQTKDKQKGVEIKDAEDSDRPRATSTSIKKVQEDWEAEEEMRKLAEEEATKAALIQDFNDIHARIEAIVYTSTPSTPSNLQSSCKAKRPRPQPDDDSDDEHKKCLRIITFDSTLDSEIIETKSFVSKLHKIIDGILNKRKWIKVISGTINKIGDFNDGVLYEACGVCIQELKDWNISTAGLEFEEERLYTTIDKISFNGKQLKEEYCCEMEVIRNMTLFQLLDFPIHDFYSFFHKVEFVIESKFFHWNDKG
ncbi:hypothetical protein Tco_0276254 [Tanacetum coccineum]